MNNSSVNELDGFFEQCFQVLGAPECFVYKFFCCCTKHRKIIYENPEIIKRVTKWFPTKIIVISIDQRPNFIITWNLICIPNLFRVSSISCSNLFWGNYISFQFYVNLSLHLPVRYLIVFHSLWFQFLFRIYLL